MNRIQARIDAELEMARVEAEKDQMDAEIR
jgi:hypothetical protein